MIFWWFIDFALLRHLWTVFLILRVIFVISGDDLPCGEIFGQFETFSTSKICYLRNLNLHLLWDPGVEFQKFEKKTPRETYTDSENTNNLSNYNNAEIFLYSTIFRFFELSKPPATLWWTLKEIFSSQNWFSPTMNTLSTKWKKSETIDFNLIVFEIHHYSGKLK